MKSKYIFEDLKKDLKEDHLNYETHQENTEVIKARCDHMGKVSIVDGILRCDCGSGWQGGEIETLYKLFNPNN